MIPGELRKRRDEWLLDLKLELIRILRDYGKCLSFGPGGKKMWMKFPAIEGVALVYSSGDILRCNLFLGTNGEEHLDLKPGKDPSVFSPAEGIPIHLLLEFVESYPTNPFL